MGDVGTKTISSVKEDLFNLCKVGLNRDQTEALGKVLCPITNESAARWLEKGQDGIDILQTRAGNNESFDRIWERQKQFAKWFISQCVPSANQADRDDCLSRVYLDMLDLIDKYSPEKYEGLLFDLLAKRRIKWAVLKEIRSKNNSIHGLLTRAVSMDNSDKGRSLHETLGAGHDSILPETPLLEEVVRRLDPKEIEGLEYKTHFLIRLEGAEELGVFEKAAAILCGRRYTIDGISEVLRCTGCDIEDALISVLDKGYLICQSRQEQVVRLTEMGYMPKDIGGILHISAKAASAALFSARYKSEVTRPENQEPVFSQMQSDVKVLMDKGLCAKEVAIKLPQYSIEQIRGAMYAVKKKAKAHDSGPHFGPLQKLVKDAISQGFTYDQILKVHPHLTRVQLHTIAYAVRRKLSNEPIELSEHEQAVVDKYLAGESRAAIAEELEGDWTVSKVSSTLSHARAKQPSLRLARPSKQVVLSDLERQVLEKALQDLPAEEIAEQLDRKPDAVYAAFGRIREKGHELPAKVRLTPFQTKVAEWAKKGYGHRRISHELSCSSSSAAGALRALRKKGVIPKQQPASVEPADPII